MEYIKQPLKIILIAILVIPTFISTFIFVFYSAALANISQIIKLRDNYLNLLYKVIQISQIQKQPIVFNPIYTFSVREWEGLYYYTFTGTFEEADLENAVIYLKAKNNKVYALKVSKKFIEQQTEFKLNNLGFSPTTDRVDIDDLPLSKNSQVKITWEDERTLSTILKDYSKDKNRPLNANSTLFFNITKRK